MASTLTVSLNREKRQLVLTVIDNGKGFDVKGMQQRLTTDGKLGLLGYRRELPSQEVASL
jgi:signal transduction histidine kinase